jgi:hypothetical protein
MPLFLFLSVSCWSPAAASYKTTAGLEGSGSGATGFLTGAVTQTASPDIDLVDVLMTQAKKLPQLAAANPAGSLTGVVVSETIACTNSGSISITFDDADNNQQLSTGDSMSFNASNCAEDGMTMNATVSSSELGGSVSIVTDTVFQGFDLDYPSSGQATITGANLPVCRWRLPPLAA